MKLTLAQPNAHVRPLLVMGLLVAFTILFAVLIHVALNGINLGADFYTFWLAGKATLLQHIDPYSAQVTLQSQLGIYGRAALPGEDQVAFAYPPYSLLVVVPLVFLPFDWAYAGWLSFNLVGFLVILFPLFRQNSRPLSLTALLLFPVFICLATGNFSVFISGILLFFFGLLVVRGKTTPILQILSAVLLAWSTIKPQFTWLFIFFILLYALRQRLFYFLGSFFSALLAYFIFSFIFVPGWIVEWPVRIQQYAGYVNSRPVLSDFLMLFLPQSAAMLASFIMFFLGLVLTGLFFYRWWKGRLAWFNVLAWVGMFTYLFHLHGMSYDQMTFLAPLLLWVGQQVHWKSWSVVMFWFGSILVSWLAFGLGSHSIAVDRAPVLYNSIWVTWLLMKKDQ